MTIQEAQQKIKTLLGSMEHPRLGSFIALTEEVGELANEIMKVEIYEEKENIDDLKGEMADVFVSLLELANVYNVDLSELFAKKVNDIEPRAKEWATKFGPTLKKKRAKLD